jgi:hypothetical protein
MWQHTAEANNTSFSDFVNNHLKKRGSRRLVHNIAFIRSSLRRTQPSFVIHHRHIIVPTSSCGRSLVLRLPRHTTRYVCPRLTRSSRLTQSQFPVPLKKREKEARFECTNKRHRCDVRPKTLGTDDSKQVREVSILRFGLYTTMTKNNAARLAPNNQIRVNGIHMGWCQTDIASMFVRKLSHPTMMSRFLPVLALLLSFVTGSFSFQSHTTFRMRAADAAAAGITKLRMATNNNNNIVVRDWKYGDEAGIRSLLSSSASKFDPEGPLDIDCGGPQALQESYDLDDGGCFLVATTTTTTTTTDKHSDSETILGTAGLIVGTQIQYLQSGASIAAPPKVTGAIRRVCCRASKQEQESSNILRALLMTLETRALEQQATELIILAYPGTTNTEITTSIARPTFALLEDIGYQPLPVHLGGINAKQYWKQLDRRKLLQKPETLEHKDASLDNTKQKKEESSTGMVRDTAIGGGVLTFLLIAILSVATILGFDVSLSVDNRGLGAPLYTQELQRLQQDEKLKRTDLDAGVGSGGARQWTDLNAEELREEAALMKIIQGETVRLQ